MNRLSTPNVGKIAVDNLLKYYSVYIYIYIQYISLLWTFGVLEQYIYNYIVSKYLELFK